jgi:threonine synthase
MRRTHDHTGLCICPHSATAVHAAELLAAKIVLPGDQPQTAAVNVCVLTAHPAKFEDAVRKAIGIEPPTLAVVEALRAVPASEHRFTELLRTPGWKLEWSERLKRDVSASDAAVKARGSGSETKARL